jgi:hypothetical protein
MIEYVAAGSMAAAIILGLMHLKSLAKLGLLMSIASYQQELIERLVQEREEAKESEKEPSTQAQREV